MTKNITVGIDIGTSSTKVVVAEGAYGEDIKIIGVGQAETKGMKNGYITKPEEIVRSVKRAINEAEKSAGIKIKHAYVSISSASLSSEVSVGAVIISKADNEVTELDINKALADSEKRIGKSNKKVLHSYPLAYKLDGKDVMGKAIGMNGSKLEVKSLFITALTQHVNDCAHAVALAGVDVIEVVASPIAEGHAMLSEKQKSAGCILVDIGKETVACAVFEDGEVVSLHSFPIGSNNITNDIALGFQIPLEEADGLKIGSVIGNFPKRKLDEIINARLTDIFELIDSYLKKIKRSGLLPAGVILSGGGSLIPGIEDIAKHVLKLPVRHGIYDYITQSKNKIKDPSWLASYGLIHYGIDKNNGEDEENIFSPFKKWIKGIIKQLLP